MNPPDRNKGGAPMASEAIKRRFNRKHLLTCFLCSLFFCLTILFFSPMEIVLNNINDFRFSFQNVWLFQLAVAVLSACVMTLVILLFPPRVGRVLAAVAAAGGFAAWVQCMVLNGSMTVLTGEETVIPTGQKILNLVIFLLVFAAFLTVYFLIRKKSKIMSHRMLQIACALLIVMQGGAMAALAAGTDLSQKPSSYYLTNNNMFDFTRGTNVVMIILDTADDEYTEEMLSHYPELYDSLSGWTYYANATSTYSRTYPSLTYLLTGEKCYFDMKPADYCNQAFRNSGFLPAIKAQGTDIRVYSPKSDMLREEGMKQFSNSVNSGDERKNLAYFQLEKNLVRISLNRCMPYLLKDLFRYDINIINLSSFTYRPFHQFMDPMIYDALDYNGGINVSDSDENTFVVYHLWSTHPNSSWWDSNLKPADQAVYYDILRGSFRFVEAMIDEMKKAGIYDQTLLIVTADHGKSGGDRANHERNRASCPLLMVKYPNSDLSKPMTTSRAPVSHDDLFATILEAFSCKDTTGYGSGETLADQHEKTERTRIHYYTAIDQKIHEVALVEYEIDGDAMDFSTWHKTGRYWDVQYSVNAVSTEKYKP